MNSKEIRAIKVGDIVEAIVAGRRERCCIHSRPAKVTFHRLIGVEVLLHADICDEIGNTVNERGAGWNWCPHLVLTHHQVIRKVGCIPNNHSIHTETVVYGSKKLRVA